MNGAYDDERLAVAQRAYNEVMSDLVGRTTPDENLRDSVAYAVLYMARTEQRDWEPIAVFARAQALNLLRERELLVGLTEKAA